MRSAHGLLAAHMLPSVRAGCSRFILLLLSCALLGSCAAGPRHSGFSGGALRLDTETVGRMRHAAALKRAAGVAVSTVAAASTIALLAPEVLGFFQNDEEELSRLEVALLECVQRAERDINAERFGHGAPTVADCNAVVGVDRCGRPIYQSMELGNLKHARALTCMQDILKELWPGPVSIEQRYRFYRHAKVLETVSREEEKRLLDADCAEELRGTIKPDVVLHADRKLLRAILLLDLKFPCPADRDPKWTEYGHKSTYSGSSQGRIYQEALGGKALMLSPKGIFE
ncbi:hypothetical protein [Cystobacter ferrugineus]|nr:hypothetical protein [Cystobacter ferrugineus]